MSAISVASSTTPSNAAALDLLNQQNNAMGKQTLNQTDFFKLLTAQLAAQDPLKPMDDMSFISQMASFSSLQQMQTLSSDIANFTQQQGVSNANSYLGKTVTVSDANGASVAGVVTSISIDSGTPMLTVNGLSYGVDAVTSVAFNQPTTADNASNTNTTAQ